MNNKNKEPSPLVMNAANVAALESFMRVAETFRQRAAPYISAIDEGGCASEDELSEVFDASFKLAQTALQTTSVVTERKEIDDSDLCGRGYTLY